MIAEDKWIVKVSTSDGTVSVTPCCRAITIPFWTQYVKKPNWIERRLKITFEQKTENAIKFVQAKCDKWNKETADAEATLENVLSELPFKTEKISITDWSNPITKELPPTPKRPPKKE